MLLIGSIVFSKCTPHLLSSPPFSPIVIDDDVDDAVLRHAR
jgi:hypothetical protein